MSASFLVVLLILSAVVEPDGKPRPRRRAARPRVEMSPQNMTAETRGRDAHQKTAGSDSDPAHSQDSPSTKDIPAEGQAEKAGRILRAEQQVRQATQAAQEFKIVRKELRQQIAALKQERQLMLAELAVALTTISTTEAVNQVEALDDAAAVEVLRRTSQARRKEILERLDPKRARGLRRKL